MAGLELQIETGGEPAGSCLTALAGFLLRAPHAPWSPLGRTRSKQVGRPVPWLSGSLQLHNHHQSGQGGLRSELVTIRLVAKMVHKNLRTLLYYVVGVTAVCLMIEVTAD